MYVMYMCTCTAQKYKNKNHYAVTLHRFILFKHSLDYLYSLLQLYEGSHECPKNRSTIVLQFNSRIRRHNEMLQQQHQQQMFFGSLVAATVVAATVVAATVVAVEEANFTKVVNLRQVVDVHPRVEAIIEAILNDELI